MSCHGIYSVEKEKVSKRCRRKGKEKVSKRCRSMVLTYFRMNQAQRPASTPLEPGNGCTQPSFNFPLPLGAEDFASVPFAHIKAVDGGAFLGADFRHGNVQFQFGQRLRNGVEQTDVVFGLDVNHRARVGRFVVEARKRVSPGY